MTYEDFFKVAIGPLLFIIFINDICAFEFYITKDMWHIRLC